MGGQHGPRQCPFLRARLGDSAKHRRELKNARAHGVSRRRFLGWEPSETTIYGYDDSGRLVSAVTTREPEFDDTDRGWLYALDEIENDQCPGGCGQPLAESTAVGADDDYRVRRFQCHACATRDRDSEGRDRLPGELVIVTHDPTLRAEGDDDG